MLLQKLLITGNMPWVREGLLSFFISCLRPQFQEHCKLDIPPRAADPLLSALLSPTPALFLLLAQIFVSPICPRKLTFNPHEFPKAVPSTVTKTPVSASREGKMSRQWGEKWQCEIFLGSYYQSKVFRNLQSGRLGWSWFRADSHLCTTLNFFAQALYTGWGLKLQLQHPEDLPFPVPAAARDGSTALL